MQSLQHLRIAMKFSLWMWAIYWPVGGLLLLAAGMTDPISILVMLLTLGGFLLVLASGGVEASSSRNMRTFLVERPLYVIAGAVLLTVVSSVLPVVQNLGLLLFSGLYLGGIVYVGVTLRRHLEAQRMPFIRSGADQVVITLVLGGVAASAIFLDALLPLFQGGTTPSNATSVILLNWLSIFYPPMLLLSMRPFREPLRNPLRRRNRIPAGPTPQPVPVEA